ncbi:TetR family transcriptional regulator [Murinocardiopsis flavida]|uniref:TetR family transcriptional regulator n=1 Tax=Murinocardiopsis flavida TaxID=645275 RepID=A0A2P8CLZ2_9ACTN|nr:TetR/AcrR family transcriptional regulator [Murinocardiopsis flavida]PSK85981.1 TetR family transcriptional regulator [Murinocardiopsis flavida]
MTSIRNVDDAILDAARACVEAFGVRRTTLTDVARRAGVSRPTVYRRWPDVSSLVADLLTRELRGILAAAAVERGAVSVRERLVGNACGVLRGLLDHPLFAKVIDHEPELLATYAFHRLGTSQYAALDLVRPEIEAGQRDGSIRAGDPEALARMVLVVVQHTATSRRLTADAMDDGLLVAELAALLDGYLAARSAAPVNAATERSPR